MVEQQAEEKQEDTQQAESRKKIGFVQVEFKGERSDYFVNSKQLPIAEGDYIVVQVERGRDMGRVIRVGEILDKVTKIRRITQEVLRKSSEEDIVKFEENKLKEDEARRKCEEKIAERGLKMKLVDVEYQLDSSKITFFFTADERVDFRELVKDLAGIYKTRIELRQIGVRDEAKRLGGYGSCGRRFCCTTWLQEFEPVTLKMARDQSLSVSPTKISGACGRLMCCLAYERDYYMRVAKRLPKVGAKVETPYGDTKVTDVDIFAQSVVVEDENGNEMRFTLDQVTRNGPARKASTVWTVTTGLDDDDDEDDYEDHDDHDDHDDDHDDHDEFDEISDQDNRADREDRHGR
jgi:cell fate regulator YaaT (PSP1 superfamily)